MRPSAAASPKREGSRKPLCGFGEFAAGTGKRCAAGQTLRGWANAARLGKRCAAGQTLRGWANAARLGAPLQRGRACGLVRPAPSDLPRQNGPGRTAPAERPRQNGPKPRLPPEQEAVVAGRVGQGPGLGRDGVVRWRCVGLRERIKREWGVGLRGRTVGKPGKALALPVLRRLAFRLAFRRLSVRPQHPKSGPAAQAVFRTGSRALQRPACPRRPRASPLGRGPWTAKGLDPWPRRPARRNGAAVCGWARRPGCGRRAARARVRRATIAAVRSTCPAPLVRSGGWVRPSCRRTSTGTP